MKDDFERYPHKSWPVLFKCTATQAWGSVSSPSISILVLWQRSPTQMARNNISMWFECSRKKIEDQRPTGEWSEACLFKVFKLNFVQTCLYYPNKKRLQPDSAKSCWFANSVRHVADWLTNLWLTDDTFTAWYVTCLGCLYFGKVFHEMQ